MLSKDKTFEVGCISKKWSGILREAFTDADNFAVSFPMDLDVRMKAVMIGASFLIVSQLICTGNLILLLTIHFLITGLHVFRKN